MVILKKNLKNHYILIKSFKIDQISLRQNNVLNS